MNLFVFYLGGRTSGCRIELHDVAFCVAQKVEDCYESVKNQWFGEPKGLHLDAYAILTHADGHHIRIREQEESQNLPDEQLFFINLGGYDPRHFTEIHKTGFYVARTEQEAKAKAKSEIGQNLDVLHTDDVVDIDDCLNVSEYSGKYRLHLIPVAPDEALDDIEYICGYHLVP